MKLDNLDPNKQLISWFSDILVIGDLSGTQVNMSRSI